MLFNNREDQKHDIAFVEVCCGTNSALREACKVASQNALHGYRQANGNC